MHPILELLIGIACAFVGGELFLRGVVGISEWLRVPKSVTAATLAAFATSSPEISVGITSALEGQPTIALGDALGSNIVNVALILGLVLCIGPMRFVWKTTRREYGFALTVPFIIMLALMDGTFERWEAIACLGIFAFWLLLVVREALHERSMVVSTTTWKEGLLALVFGAIGLTFLVFAGRLIVSGASGIGTMLGMDPFLIGVTMVAFGTSAPELATAVIAKLRGHDDVGIGTILGSNIFNCLFIVGLTATIQPFTESLKSVLASILIGVLAVVLLTPMREGLLGRFRGVLLLLVYAMSIVWAVMGHVQGH